MKKSTTMLTGLAATAVGAVGVLGPATPASAQTGNTGWLPTNPNPSIISVQDNGLGPEYSRVICFEDHSQSSGYYIDVTLYDQGNASFYGSTTSGCLNGYLYNHAATVVLKRDHYNGFAYNCVKWQVGAGSSPNSLGAYTSSC